MLLDYKCSNNILDVSLVESLNKNAKRSDLLIEPWTVCGGYQFVSSTQNDEGQIDENHLPPDNFKHQMEGKKAKSKEKNDACRFSRLPVKQGNNQQKKRV